MAVIKAKNEHKERKKESSEKVSNEVSLEAQEQLVEILNDSPHIVSLAGTDWEIRSLRFGTQYLIAQEVIKINKIENANFGDIVKQFAVNIPSVIKVLTLCVLNDKKRIFKDGIEANGFSDEYHAVYDTLQWQGNVNEYGNLFLECLQMLDVSFFLQSLDILAIFKQTVTMRKTKMDEQK